ncbi:unnamed protein product [Didymodactylos carnosus]|uniref:RZ-type domain-containing protein n=1 Tax=Didymodactylos carnosus TaxID=1234261 RepID=A0A814D8D6_9BILA|nr:unnamed protein product [Didymodactylos carnosus]CAF0953644.1 unnamed protein product [Didymodactylos carnosus]CAF3555935.1 unnamed protein product [Didymodactylos carnosus]CAF3729021.1 unnamed protein product [Didymodactylos carnosus]
MTRRSPFDNNTRDGYTRIREEQRGSGFIHGNSSRPQTFNTHSQQNSGSANNRQQESSIQNETRYGGGRGNNIRATSGGVRHTNRRQVLRTQPSSLSNSTTGGKTTEKASDLPHIGYNMLLEMSNKEPDILIIDVLRPYFQFKTFLNDDRMKIKYDWIKTMTDILEKIISCTEQRERVAQILSMILGSKYLDGVHEEIRKPDNKTKQLKYDFIHSFLKISDYMLTIMPHSENDLSKIIERVQVTLPKMIESENVQNIKLLLDKVLANSTAIYERKQQQTSSKATTHHHNSLGPPPNNYRDLSVIPTMNEILEQQTVYLRENIINGVYESADHYLDVHFRLLREDFVEPLREGIDHFICAKEQRNLNVRIYKNVRNLGPRITKSSLVYEIQLDPQTTSKIYWENSRRLIYGSLLAITNDGFKTCALVTVEDRTDIQKNSTLFVRGHYGINYNANHLHISQLLLSSQLTMLETTAYFESYRPVLSALQQIQAAQFPLAPYILKLDKDVIPPSYVNATTKYDFTPLLVKPNARVTTTTAMGGQFNIQYSENVQRTYTSVTLLNKDEWPTSEQMKLNSSQRDALELALTKKVALIQGRLIRVGGRCKNPVIQPFSLIEARKRSREHRLTPRHLFEQKRQIMNKKHDAEKAVQEKEALIKQSKTNILRLSLLMTENIIDVDHWTSLLSRNRGSLSETVLIDWLGIGTNVFDDDESNNLLEVIESDIPIPIIPKLLMGQGKPDQEAEDRRQLEEAIRMSLETNDIQLESIQNDQEDQNEEEEEEERRRLEDVEIDEEFHSFSSKSSLSSQSSVTSEDVNVGEANDKEYEWHSAMKNRKRKQLISKIINTRTTLTDDDVEQIHENLWNLSMKQRRNLYQYWLSKFQQNCADLIEHGRKLFEECSREYLDYLKLEDYQILKDAVIVAMTTTCAAQYFNVLQRLGSKIVIVEEAAEIFEAHVICSLSPQCEHLILIGDHVQLRPNPTVYRLAKTFNIDVSLFERFVQNKFPSVRLNIQHRMRPEICELMKHFYTDLENHDSVKTEREQIVGIKDNLFFINHSYNEEIVSEGSSRSNPYEAHYIVELAYYLIKQGYTTSQITILVMYLGQRQLIVKLTRQRPLLKGIKTMTVDNYQGEENDIILLSLVRNNSTNDIGFLKIKNRICVALSRARCGFYIFGNLRMLQEANEMWKNIATTLIAMDAVGKALRLVCARHPDDLFFADSPQSFLKRPEGGCDKMCDARLKCGHQCVLCCHNYDQQHEKIECKKQCNDRLPCGHLCNRLCSHTGKHGPCRVMVEKVIADCDHSVKVQCSVIPSRNDCKQLVPARLPCDHLADVLCNIKETKSYDLIECKAPCQKELSCGHRCSGSCGKCQYGQLHVPCQQRCDRSLLCGHVCKQPCSKNCPPCSRKCENCCVHSRCSKICSEQCVPCKEPCVWHCEHIQCNKLCFEPCNREPCNKPCKKLLEKCRHPCIGLCGEPCPPQCRICHRNIVREIFFGTEDEDDARFVMLSDCPHFFEVTSLDRYINDFISKQNTTDDQGKSIRLPECPKCKKQIRRCTRYNRTVNEIQTWIEKVKIKQQNGNTADQIKKRREKLTLSIQDCIKTYSHEYIDSYRNLFKILSPTHPHKYLNSEELDYIENTCKFLDEMNRLLDNAKKNLHSTTIPQYQQVNRYLVKLNAYMFNCSSRYVPQQLSDIRHELHRIERFIFIVSLLKQVNEPPTARTLKMNEKETLDELRTLTTKYEQFTDQDCERFDLLREQVKHLSNIIGLAITDKERLEIVGALNLQRGHWFICPKGHPYIITECGGASQRSRCPECNSEIGGENHRLLSTNRHFSLMDNSSHAAWSEEANVANGPDPLF